MSKYFILKNAEIPEPYLGQYGDLTIKADSISDGYHTMDELYDHRRELTIHLFNLWNKVLRMGFRSGNCVIKSRLHNDGTMFSGYFVVYAELPSGQISYHYDLKYWDRFLIPELDRAPKYDGHTSLDVIERLSKL